MPSSTSPSSVPDQYYPYPASVWGLDPGLRGGLHAMGVVAAVSVASTFGLLCFITYRMIFWKRYYSSTVSHNQNVVLVYNLLVGDFFQALSFLFSFHWVQADGILAPSAACSAQGAILTLGDISSGIFVFLIAIHTAISVLWGRAVPLRYMVAVIICCWLFTLFLTVLGPAIYGKSFFTATGAWCWVNRDHEEARLWSHYIWIFIFEFGTMIIYVTTFVLLRKRIVSTRPDINISSSSSKSPNRFSIANNAAARVNRATYYMIVYPVTYVLCTAPLAVGRMYTMSTNNDNPEWFYILAGCLITSCGWIDAVVYTITRRVLVSANGPRGDSNQHSRSRSRSNHRSAGGSRPMSDTFILERRDTDDEMFEMQADPRQKPVPVPVSAFTTTTTITGGREPSRKGRAVGFIPSPEESDVESLIRSGSSDNIEGRVRAETKVEITVQEREC